ncbi:hypothetical protein D5S18_11110 [Nocardia panacis]|uniref:Uncharacterized protein n=1 Tax=Nocardia panacis TaxID=2340916 RepID=A0A3A4KBH7_9NOCA|nr:hypothetical protein D5S18_11110 [Nocardia panacis]
MRILLFTAALAAVPLLTACGGNSRPDVTAADLSDSMYKKGMHDRNLTDCAAKLYVVEGISQDGLRLMVSDEYDRKAADPNTFGMDAKDADKVRAAQEKIVAQCVGKPQ